MIIDNMHDAIEEITDNSIIMIPGFGPGAPWNLLKELYKKKLCNLTIIANSVGLSHGDSNIKTIGDFILNGMVKKIICSFTASPHPSIKGPAEQLILDKKLFSEVVTQGALAEKIRAAAAGLGGFYTKTSINTKLAGNKKIKVINKQSYVFEEPLHADFSLIRAFKADKAGNLIYRLAARNFNPIMAAAAKKTIVEVEQEIEDVRKINSEYIHTPSIYVNRLVQIPKNGIFEVDLLALRTKTRKND
jgi:3-oxoadipate CoA-transferase alpha subunit